MIDCYLTSLDFKLFPPLCARLFENKVNLLPLKILLNVYLRIECEEDENAAIICVGQCQKDSYQYFR